MSPLERLLVEEIPTGTFGESRTLDQPRAAPGRPMPRPRHLRAVPDPQEHAEGVR